MMQELKEAARVALTDCAGVREGENVVIVSDGPKRKIGLAFWEVAGELGADAIFCEIIPRKSNGAEPPRAVAALLKDCDVFMIPTSKSMTHTDARRAACKNGARGATLPNIAEDTMKRALKADYGKIQERTSQVAAAVQGAKEARVITALGTDITFSIEGRKCLEDTGIITEKGTSTNLPAGEAYLAPVEGTARGKIVADGSCAGIGMIDEPIELEVEGGFATRITGGAEAEKLIEITGPFGRDGRNIAELGIGTNDKARLIGSALEDEKVMGTVHIALGDNVSMGGNVALQSHLDMIIKAPTLLIDGKEIIKEGNLLA
jgi:leucyl aminopeptidase (aminopeptidase T)